MKPMASLLSHVLVAVASAFRAAESAPDTIHGCPDSHGTIVYQDDPCDTTAPGPARPSAASAAKPASKPASKSAPRAAAKSASPVPLAGPIRRVIDRSVFTSDPRWGSPERTLATFVAAMKAGDRVAARSCLTAEALTEFGPRVDSVPPESLRAMVDRYTGFVLEGEVGPYWSIRALRANAKPKWIFFERTGDGAWKISAI